MINILKKYSTILKYLFSAGTSFLLDLTLFTIFLFVLKKGMGDAGIFVSTVLARILSSFYNYFLNKNAVFQSGKEKVDKITLTKYYCLVVVQMLVSSTSVFFLHQLFRVPETIIKIPVDVVLFIVNYWIQKNWIFKES